MYLALYRKWRPRTFDDVISQEHITTTLKNEIISGKTAHAYLFTGSRGTGKTTCAKILAMALNCPNTKDGNPCMECEICRGIQDGSILDVLEMDAASNNGVDDVRILREEANYTPAQCRYRVYIIDETHMLSTAAFNALLKIMEEPPEHVKFILATTEVHKVPVTILSRCQRFDFRRIRTEDIQKRLMEIAQQEPFTLEEDAAFLIARLADGGMRDALSILDQCTAFSDQVTVSVVTRTAGLISRDYLFRLTDLICDGNTNEVLACVDELYAHAKDLQRLISELMEHFRDLMLVKSVQNPEQLVRSLPEELSRLRQQTERFSMASLLRSLSVLQDCYDKMARNYEKRLCVEMTLIKLCSPQLDEDVSALLQRVDRLESMLSRGNFVPQTQPNGPSETEPESNLPPKPVQTEPAADVSMQEQTLPAHESIPKPQQTEVPVSEEDTDTPVMLSIWPEVLAAVKQQNPALAGVLSGSSAFACGDYLYIDSPIALFGKMMKQEGFIKTLISVLEEQTGKSYKLRIKKAKKVQKQEKRTLDDLVEQASALGISIEEKGNG